VPTPIDRVIEDNQVPERVGIMDDQLSPMLYRSVKFSFAIKENKHHTPRHSDNYKTKFRFAQQQKGSMRQRVRRHDSLEIIRQDKARQALTQKCLELMSKGCVTTKYNRFGNPCRRIITVDKDGTEIRWESSFEHESRKKGIGFMARKPRLRQLADITGVIYSSLVEFAHRRSRFYQYNQQGHPPWVCLTVLFDQETLDLVFKNEEEVDTWFFGLQNLAPMSKFYLPRGPQLIFRAQLKIEHMSKRSGKPIMEILVDLLKQAKETVKKENEEREKEEKLARVIIEGVLKKKSPKELFGKHVWQNRYFRLEQTPDFTHSRILYMKEKNGELLGNVPIANVRCVTVPEKKKEGRLDIELKGGMIAEQRMFSLLASDEAKAVEWRDALNRLINLVHAHTPLYTEAKFWKPYVVEQEKNEISIRRTPPKKERPKQETPGKRVHFGDEVSGMSLKEKIPTKPQESFSRSVSSEMRHSASKQDGDDEDGSSESESRDRGESEENDRQPSSSQFHPNPVVGLSNPLAQHSSWDVSSNTTSSHPTFSTSPSRLSGPTHVSNLPSSSVSLTRETLVGLQGTGVGVVPTSGFRPSGVPIHTAIPNGVVPSMSSVSSMGNFSSRGSSLPVNNRPLINNNTSYELVAQP